MHEVWLWIGCVVVVLAPVLHYVGEWQCLSSGVQFDWVNHVERFGPMILCIFGAILILMSQYEGQFSFRRPEYDAVTATASAFFIWSGLAYPTKGNSRGVAVIFLTGMFFLVIALYINL